MDKAVHNTKHRREYAHTTIKIGKLAVFLNWPHGSSLAVASTTCNNATSLTESDTSV